MTNTESIWQQSIFTIFVPPIAAVVVRVLSLGWARVVQGRNISDETRKRQKLTFWVLLVVLYAMCAAIFLYADLRP